MKNRIVTISREFGSGGRTIGKKGRGKARYSLLRPELIQKIAEESGFAENYVKEAGEYAPGGFPCPRCWQTAHSGQPMRTFSGRHSAA